MFAFIIILSLSIALSLLISQPFNGALIRLRGELDAGCYQHASRAHSTDHVLPSSILNPANYLPKAISLSLESDDTDPERGAAGRSALAAGRSAAKIGPVVPGIFAMLMRTRRLEGWAGVYKGSAPVVAQLLVVSLASSLFFAGASASAHGQYKAAPSGPDAFGFWKNLFFMGFMALVALPLNVITHR